MEEKTRNRTAPTTILPSYERLRVVRFSPRGIQGRPGGPKKLQIPFVICCFGGFTDFKGHFEPLACISAPLCENCAATYTKCILLPLKAENPAIPPRWSIRVKIIVFLEDSGSGSAPGGGEKPGSAISAMPKSTYFTMILAQLGHRGRMAGFCTFRGKNMDLV